MKTCPECARTYAQDALVCAFDGTPLSAGTTASWSQRADPLPAVGDVLGVFRIEARIGEGGMGVIYRAQHVRIGRSMALKVLRPELSRNRDVVGLFFSEARAVNEIQHPNIVDIIDLVVVDDVDPPLVYMVMELLVGQDVGRRVARDGPVDPAEVLRVADEAVRALGAAHQRKIIHRDIKPENIFIVDGGGAPTVKVLDFGVAAIAASGPRITAGGRGGIAVGTPAYMAPEQILGQPVDARTDVYALGLVLYFMLTGELPFSSARFGDLLRSQVHDPPRPISAARVGSVVPPGLEHTVLHCLAKAPADRPQSMAALGDELERAVRGAFFGRGRSRGQRTHTTTQHSTTAALPKLRALLWLLIALAALLVVAAVGIPLFFISVKPHWTNAPQRGRETPRPAAGRLRPTTESPSKHAPGSANGH